MKRPSTPLSRREVFKTFGLSALLLSPVLRSMAYAQESTFKGAPRYVMFFKGGAFYPSRTNPDSLSDLAQIPDTSPIAPLRPFARDINLFRGMNTHGGKPRTNGYTEEHAAGIYGCVTGHEYKYFKNDAYFAYTDHESIDVRIAREYATRPELQHLLKGLYIGGGAHSDADQVGEGNRFISFTERVKGDSSHWGNAIQPMQDAGEVYKLLLKAAAKSCAAVSNQPLAVSAGVTKTVAEGKGAFDLFNSDIRNFASTLGAEQKHQLAALQEDMYELDTAAHGKPAVGAPQGKAAAAAPQSSCASAGNDGGFNANGAKKKNLDDLSPVHSQMIKLIKFAFQHDLTRVVAFTLSGASSGQVWPSQGINRAHHDLEHKGDVDGLVKIDKYYSQKFGELLTALKEVKEGDKDALYNSSILLGMECWSNSSSGHYLKNIPFVLAGHGAGAFETGKIVDARGRNINDVHVDCMKAGGINADSFGLASLCQRGPIVPQAAGQRA